MYLSRSRPRALLTCQKSDVITCSYYIFSFDFRGSLRWRVRKSIRCWLLDRNRANYSLDSSTTWDSDADQWWEPKTTSFNYWAIILKTSFILLYRYFASTTLTDVLKLENALKYPGGMPAQVPGARGRTDAVWIIIQKPWELDKRANKVEIYCKLIFLENIKCLDCSFLSGCRRWICRRFYVIGSWWFGASIYLQVTILIY